MSKKGRVAMIIVVVLCGIWSCQATVFADVGGSSGFGGGSSGGESSSSGSGSSGSSSGASGNYHERRRGRRSSDPYSFLASMVGGVLFISCARYFFNNKSQGDTRTNGKAKESDYNYEEIDEDAVIQEIQQRDINFDAVALKKEIEELYIIVQKAWMNKDLDTLSLIETPTLFNMHKRQIEGMEEGEEINYLLNQKVKDVTISSFEIVGNQEMLEFRVNAKCTDYTMRGTSLVEGDKEAVHKRAYQFNIVRKKGAQTSMGKKHFITRCPQCNEKMKVEKKVYCPICGRTIEENGEAWKLDVYMAWIWSNSYKKDS